jgi:hypothetical protein
MVFDCKVHHTLDLSRKRCANHPFPDLPVGNFYTNRL